MVPFRLAHVDARGIAILQSNAYHDTDLGGMTIEKASSLAVDRRGCSEVSLYISCLSLFKGEQIRGTLSEYLYALAVAFIGINIALV